MESSSKKTGLAITRFVVGALCALLYAYNTGKLDLSRSGFLAQAAMDAMR